MLTAATLLFLLARPTVTNPQKTAIENAGRIVEATQLTRTINYSNTEWIMANVRHGYQLIVVLPKTESILDFLAGDRENWTVSGADNFAFIKPRVEGLETNINLVTASGNVYTLLVRSDSAAHPRATPDFKIFINLTDDEMNAALLRPPKFVPASEIGALKTRVEDAEARAQKAVIDADKAGKDADAVIERNSQQFRADFPAKLKFYPFQADSIKHGSVFGVRAIATDGTFTYIWAHPREAPTVWEIKDGKPSIINFTLKNGLYTIEKVIDSGYLAVGKQKLEFGLRGDQ